MPQLFVRVPSGALQPVNVDISSSSTAELQAQLEALVGIPAAEQLLARQGGQLLQPRVALAQQGVQGGDTLQLLLRLCGGKPVKVKLLVPAPLPGVGPEVEVDLETDTPTWQVKVALAKATGVPVANQKLMLSGIGSLVMLDKRSNIGHSHCGSTNNFYFAALGGTAQQPAAPGGPQATP